MRNNIDDNTKRRAVGNVSWTGGANCVTNILVVSWTCFYHYNTQVLICLFVFIPFRVSMVVILTAQIRHIHYFRDNHNIQTTQYFNYVHRWEADFVRENKLWTAIYMVVHSTRSVQKMDWWRRRSDTNRCWTIYCRIPRSFWVMVHEFGGFG